MKAIVIAMTSLVLAVTPLLAVQYVVMDPTSVIPVELSSQNHNRIGIVGDRVKKAFFKASEISVDIEEGTGQLFVQTIKAFPTTTTLSVVSASGEVQELELIFRSGSSEIILLQPKDPVSLSPSLMMTVDSLEKDSIQQVVTHVLQGTVPEGYETFDDPDPAPEIIRGLKVERIARLVGDKQIVFIYRAQNTCKKEICVTECQVNVLDGDWVFLDRSRLQPEECTIVLIGCYK
jgi:hypothetical protein